MKFKLKRIAGDASFREFYRVNKNKKNSIIVVSNKEKFKNLTLYVVVNKILLQNKIHAPKLLSENIDKNFIEISDLGNKSLTYFVKNKKSFNRENMFFCRSKSLLNEYYKCIFNWLRNCEDVFGFNLHGYSKKRIYAFLAERFVSYWFQKNSNYRTWPIFFFDTNANKLILK